MLSNTDKSLIRSAITSAEAYARKIEDIHSEASEKYDSRSDRYHDSDAGAEAYHRLEYLRESFEYLDDAADALRSAIE